MSITWLHLSDFHFCTDKSPKGKVEDYNRDLVLEKLLDDLRTYPKENNLEIDFIVITGDIAFSSQKDEYEKAAEFLDKLLGIFNLPKNSLFIVPGNHDVDREKINPYLKPFLEGRNEITGFLSNKAAKSIAFDKFSNYKNFINIYFGKYLEFDFEDRYFWVKRFSLKGIEIGLLGLNSAWNSCGDEDRNNLLIGEKQVRDALAQVGEADLSIAVFHHPLEWMRDDDREDIERVLKGKCQFILHGHLHMGGIKFEATPDSSFITIPAGACYEKRPYSNSYNILSLDPNTKQATLHFRRYSDKLGFWQADNETFINVPNAIHNVDLNRFFMNVAPEFVATPDAEAPTIQLEPHFAHSKPLEEFWAGRKAELAQLSQWYQDETIKVIGLVGFGGVGKSALARHWLEEIEPDGIFWWCFYHEPSLDAFLLATLNYLSGGKFRPEEARSAYARVRKLLDYMAHGRFVLVLDGLEEMQAAESKGEHFGEMKETPFTDLVRGFAERDHKSLALITTRYPIKDLQSYESQSYHRLQLEHLSPEDARELMRNRGVTGEDKSLDETALDYNYHALSLKLIAGYFKEFFNGDIAHVSEIPFSAIEADKKVGLILSAYHDKLDDAQKAFMSIFSIFRRPVEEDAFRPIFRYKIKPLGNRALAKMDDFKFRRMRGHLVKLGLISEDKHGDHIAYSIHPLIRRYYYEHLEEETRISIHQRIAQYYDKKAHPTPKTLDDLTYAIEAFHHTIQANNYDKADEIYDQNINIRDALGNVLMSHNLGAFELDLSLISQLFPDGDTSQNPLVTSADRRAWLVNNVGFCLMKMGRLGDAVPFLQQAIQIATEKKNWVNASVGGQNLCLIQLALGNLSEGEAVVAQALDWARQANNKRNESDTSAFLAYAVFLQGKNNEARKFFDQANDLQRERNPVNKWVYVDMGIYYAEFLVRNVEVELAEEVTKENLTVCQRNSWPDTIASCYRLLAGLNLEKPDYSQAEEYLNEGIEIARNIDYQEEIAQLHLGFARLYLARNELPKADSAIKETLSICGRCHYKIFEIDARNVLSKIYIAAKKPTLARTEAEKALAMSEECSYHWGKIDAEEILGQLPIPNTPSPHSSPLGERR